MSVIKYDDLPKEYERLSWEAESAQNENIAYSLSQLQQKISAARNYSPRRSVLVKMQIPCCKLYPSMSDNKQEQFITDLYSSIENVVGKENIFYSSQDNHFLNIAIIPLVPSIDEQRKETFVLDAIKVRNMISETVKDIHNEFLTNDSEYQKYLQTQKAEQKQIAHDWKKSNNEEHEKR